MAGKEGLLFLKEKAGSARMPKDLFESGPWVLRHPALKSTPASFNDRAPATQPVMPAQAGIHVFSIRIASGDLYS
jgi:hypothetical protein